MLAYQMIYTACGKDKSGAFSVWAKSNEIDKKECDDIVKLMSYKKPKDAPYDPTLEEIKTLFPQKYGYFVLSSGRKCFAKSSYIGQVYSDLDGRSGNFIIHAYVFDSLDDSRPFGLPDSDLFLRELTYKQWHDDPVPENLPSVNITVKDNLTEEDMKSYLQNSQNLEIFARILQSAIDCADSDKVITFNGTEEEQKCIYALLGRLLPEKYVEKLTFANQYSTQSEYALLSSGVPPIKIRNVFGGNSAAFNFADEIEVGNYAFDLTNSVCAAVKIGSYVREIVKTAATKSYFDTLKRVDEINSIIKRADCSPDVAYDILNFLAGDFGYFNTVSALTATLDLVLKYKYKDVAACSRALYNSVVVDKKWGYDSSVSQLLKLVYQYADEQQKTQMLVEVLNRLEAFGISKNQSPKEFLDNLKGYFPLDYEDLRRAMLYSKAIYSMFSNATDDCVTYVYLDTLVSMYEVNKDASFRKKAQEEMLKVFKKAASQKDFSAFGLYLERIQSLGSQAEHFFVYNVFSRLFTEKTTSEQDLKLAFKIATDLRNADNRLQFVAKVVKNNLNASYLMNVYLAECEKDKKLFEEVERFLQSDKEAQVFFIKKNSYAFKTATTVTDKTLQKYFVDYYLKGYDDGTFYVKYKQYVATLTNATSKLKELFSRYDVLFKLDDGFTDLLKLIRFIYEEILSVDVKELTKLNLVEINKITAIHKRLLASNPSFTSDKYDELFALLLLQGKFGKDTLYRAVAEETVYGKIVSGDMEKFAVSYFSYVVKVYVEVQQSDKLPSSVVLKSLIYPVVMNVRNFGEAFRKAFAEIDTNSFYVFMVDVMAYAFNQQDEFAAKLRNFVTLYVEESTRSDNKKLFAKVKALLTEEEYSKVAVFIDEYNETHKSFFEKLFGKKKK